MSGKCTTKDIARELGIAQSTVSRVLNNSPAASVVSDATRQKIMEAVERMGYVPNANARRLAQNKSNIIGLVLPGQYMYGDGVALADASFSKTAGGMEAVFRRKGYRLLLIFNDDNFIKKRDYISCLKSRYVDGLIVWGARTSENYWNETAGMNVVMINSKPLPECAIDYIGSDNFNATYELTKKLIEAGRRKIVYYDGYQGISISEERFAGYKQALADFSIPFQEELCFRGTDYQAQLEDIVELKKRIPDAFNAIQCLNNSLALVAGLAMHKMKLRIPDDVMLAGGDNVNNMFSQFRKWRFPVMSFTPPYYEQGRLAAEWIIETIEKKREPSSPRELFLPVEFTNQQQYGEIEE